MTREEWAAKQLDDRCAALASMTQGGRANELFKSASWLGKLVGAGRLAESAARAGLSAACERNGLMREDRAGVESGITRGLDAGRREPLEEREPTSSSRESGRAALDRMGYPPRAEVAKVWALGQPLATDAAVAKWARERGIDPDVIDGDTARVLSTSAQVPPCAYAKSGRRSWPHRGYRVVVPLFDVAGELGSVLFRFPGKPPQRADAAKEPIKSASAQGKRTGLVMACSIARSVLESGSWFVGANRVLLIAEGETDFLKAASWYGARADRPGVLGVVSGSITEELVARIPTRTRIIIATDDDKAGDDYAAKLIAFAAPRARAGELTLERFRPGRAGEYSKGGGADLGDVMVPVERGNEPVDLDNTSERTLWRDTLSYNDKNEPHGSLANTVTILANDEAWTGVVGYDERGGTITLLRAPPFPRDVKFGSSTTPRALCDADLSAIAVWLARTHRVNVTSRTIFEAIGLAARKNPFDHVRSYLETLAWDDVPRIDTALVRHLGGDDTPFARAAVRKWMISAVARAFEAGCKADHALILEGPQGIGKSTFFRALAPRDEFFLDDLKDVSDRTEVGRQIGRAWIIELAELNALSRAEAGQIKAFLTKQIDDVRMPYATTYESHPRRCVFGGTTNESRYLDDPTGNRRFWPVRCSSALNVAELAAERDLLWAEAVTAYRRGESWHLGGELEVEAKAEQAGRLRGDPWEETIASFLATRTVSVTTGYILSNILEVRAQEQDRGKEMRVAGVLKSLGWERRRTMQDGARVYAFHPPEPALPGIDTRGGRAGGRAAQSDLFQGQYPTFPTCPTKVERREGEDRVSIHDPSGGFPTQVGSRAGEAAPPPNYDELDPEWGRSR